MGSLEEGKLNIKGYCDSANLSIIANQFGFEIECLVFIMDILSYFMWNLSNYEHFFGA